ncbi:hypothetical protein CRP207_gp75 [Roseobacter phage CRP-207]|jgi:hypothetical protein|nr:hypothetical protein CRP207_gp75 [Roseobacter phage CRP-207]
MHRHLLSLDKRKLLSNLYVKTVLFVVLLATSAGAGDVTGDFSTSNENSTVDSNNSDETVTNNYNATGAGSAAPVMSAIAPTMMGGGGNDSCLLPSSTGIQISVLGLSSGKMEQDEACNRRKNARLLGAPQQVGGLGLQVSAISVLCQDPVVFRSMMLANTPCPINDSKTGKLLMGKAAIKKYRESPALYIVGYETDQAFWDTLLRVGEEDLDDETVEDDTPKLSLSERFRSSKRTRD